jgi:hypothetical protein
MTTASRPLLDETGPDADSQVGTRTAARPLALVPHRADDAFIPMLVNRPVLSYLPPPKPAPVSTAVRVSRTAGWSALALFVGFDLAGLAVRLL